MTRHLASTLLAFAGALVSSGGALIFSNQQAQQSSAPLWPLPGLVLAGWAVLGMIVLLAVYLRRGGWMQAGWASVGALAMLSALGMFSIGPVVLLALLFCLPAMILAGQEERAGWARTLGPAILGAAGCAAALLLARMIA
jgi:hypothetical protein